MRHILRVAKAFAASIVLLNTMSPMVSGDVPLRSELEPARPMNIFEMMSVNIRAVAQLLRSENIPIDAGLLFTPSGRQKLRAQLTLYPDMQITKTLSGPLRGVVMADTLTFPGTSLVDGDTLIIARQVIFTGRAPTIKGAHDFHLFVLDSINVENGAETVINIDTSGSHGIAGVDGPKGKKDGIGGPGTNGTNGSNAGNQTIMFSNINAGSFHIIANGGDGGAGGRGGPGGAGGSGGNGGRAGWIVISPPSKYLSDHIETHARAGSGGRLGIGGGSVYGNGTHGQSGESGDLTGATVKFPSDFKNGKGGIGAEPGVTTETCTQWFSVHGREYIGCF
jgi:hypothetical protein